MKIRSLFIWTLGVTACVLSAQCASSKKTELSAKDHYQLASKYLAKKDYIKAIEAFQTLVYNFPGSEWVDDAQYGLAESYFLSADYVNALFEYERIVNDFSMSPSVEKAQFKIAMCYFEQSLDALLDQENTYQAMQAFINFIEDYPNSSLAEEARVNYTACKAKLAEKAYKNGELYLKRNYYEAALLYFREVLDHYGDTPWVHNAQFGIGCVFLKQGKMEEARQAFEKVVQNGADARLKRKATQKLKDIEKGG